MLARNEKDRSGPTGRSPEIAKGNVRAALATLGALGMLVFVASGCGLGDAPKEITEVRTVQPRTAAPSNTATSAERLGYGTSGPASDSHHDSCPHADTGTRGSCCPDGGNTGPVQQVPATVIWEKPTKWVEESGNAMRLVSFILGKAKETECYVTVLPASGGGLLANVNRWRNQMGLAPLTPKEIEALPTVSVLGRRAPLLDLLGSLKDSDGGHVGSDYGLLGTICEQSEQTVFVKMVGPKEDIEAEKRNFIAFCELLSFS